jgi:CBS domain-containing protein
MAQAKDIMTKEVVCVNLDTPISLIVRILATRKMTGIPVIDVDKKLLGIISEKDIMREIVNNENYAQLNAVDLMTAKDDIECFDPEDDIDKVCVFLADKPFRRVPILSDGRLMGIVSRSDIIAQLYEDKFCKK